MYGLIGVHVLMALVLCEDYMHNYHMSKAHWSHVRFKLIFYFQEYLFLPFSIIAIIIIAERAKPYSHTHTQSYSWLSLVTMLRSSHCE